MWYWCRRAAGFFSILEAMRQVIYACFAHPDDEAFGPSGTLYKAAQAGAAVHLILITGGDAGRNSDGHKDLGAIRLEEWQQSARLIGASSTTALGYKDGELCNNRYLAIAGQVLHYISTTMAGYPDAELTLISNDPNGITGHLDHITASLVATYAYLKLREQPDRRWQLGQLKYVCLPDTLMPRASTDWLYMPRGRRPEEIDEITDISDISDKKLEIMKVHYSQRKDMEANLRRSDDMLKHEYFMYYKD